MCAFTDSNGNRLTPVESFLFHTSTARTPYKYYIIIITIYGVYIYIYILYYLLSEHSYQMP